MMSLRCKVPSQSHELMHHSTPGERVTQLKWLSATVYGLRVEPCVPNGTSALVSLLLCQLMWRSREKHAQVLSPGE